MGELYINKIKYDYICIQNNKNTIHGISSFKKYRNLF